MNDYLKGNFRVKKEIKEKNSQRTDKKKKFKDDYTVTANGCKINAYPDKFLTNESYKTLEQAKEAAILFADSMTRNE